MKYLAFFVLITSFSFAQTRPSLKTQVDDRVLPTDEYTFHREGAPFSGNPTAFSTGLYTTTLTSGATAYIRKTISVPDSVFFAPNVQPVGAGKIGKMNSLVITCDRPCKVTYNIKQGSHTGTNNNPGTIATNTIALGKLTQTAVIPFGINLYEGATIGCAFTSAEKGQEIPYATVSITGDEHSPNDDFKATNRGVLLANSIGWSNWGTENDGSYLSPRTLWINRIEDYLNKQGASLRIDNKAFGSSDTRHMINGIDNFLYAPNPSFIICAYGSNDMNLLTVPVVNYKANLKRVVTSYRNRQRRKVPVIYVAPYPTDRTGYAANYSAYVTATQESVNELIASGETDIYYYDPADPANGVNQLVLGATATTDITFTNAERVANNRLHLWGGTGGGHEKVANGIIARYGSLLLQWSK